MEYLFILVSPDSVNTDRTDVTIKCKSKKIRKTEIRVTITS